MANKRIETGNHSPNIIVQCRGSLEIRGWSETAYITKGESIKTSEGEKAHHIQGDGDLQITLPSASTVTIAESSGDLSIKNVMGEIQISEAMGDVYLNNLGSVEVNNIRGDLSVRNLSGGFKANEVNGDASFRNILKVTMAKIYGDGSLRNVNGSVQISAVMGDLVIRSVNGDVLVDEVYRDAILRNISGQTQIGLVYGDIRLRGSLPAGKHNFNANGDIVIRWPAGEPVDIQAKGSKIISRLNLEESVEEPNSLSGHIGDGGVFLILEAKGRIILKSMQKDSQSWEDFSDSEYDLEAEISGLGMHITSEINSRMSELSHRLEDKFGPEFAAMMENKAQKAALKAEMAAERAMRKAEKVAKRAQYQMGRRAPSTPPMSRAKSPPKKTSEEEQLKILKMVEKGIISPGEASDLLAAIDGS